MPLPPHRTAREKRARASAQAAIARALAHTQPPPDPESTDFPPGYDPYNWPPTPIAWRDRCRQIREDAERERARNA